MVVTEWKKFHEESPTVPGPYLWRVRSITNPDLTLTFTAAMRLRGAGYENVLSPLFDHWTGWKVVVPECEWAETTETHKQMSSYENISIEGLNIMPCPFCDRTPAIRGYRYNGGFLIGASPQEYNCWEFKCCEWGNTPSYKDPREIERIRREAFSRVLVNHA